MEKMHYLRPVASLRLRRAAEAAADFLFPWGTSCVCCGNLIDGSRPYCLCDHCRTHIAWGDLCILPEKIDLPTGPIPIDGVWACMTYGLYSRRLIFALKYNGHTYMARILAAILRDRLLHDPAAATVLQADWIIPVPIHREKLRDRGFNQAALIGRYLSGHLGIPMLENGLVRSRRTSAQRSVSGAERYANLEDAFSAGPGLARRAAGRHLILLDDIYTTGATALQCARLLKAAGARRVDVLVIATGNHAAMGRQKGNDFLLQSM